MKKIKNFYVKALRKPLLANLIIMTLVSVSWAYWAYVELGGLPSVITFLLFVHLSFFLNYMYITEKERDEMIKKSIEEFKAKFNEALDIYNEQNLKP